MMTAVCCTGQCKTVDRRYTLLDFIAQEDLMLETFQLDGDCQNSDLKSLTDPTFLAANDPDYHQSGVACESSSVTIGTQRLPSALLRQFPAPPLA